MLLYPHPTIAPLKCGGLRSPPMLTSVFKTVTNSITTICFTQKHDGNSAAVGFAQSVDGLVFRFLYSPNFSISPSDSNPEKIWAFRTAYFRYRVLIDARLCELTNVFQREWLYQIYISMLTARDLADQISLPEALRRFWVKIWVKKRQGFWTISFKA
ncbi:hypothetical protein FD724_38355 (plasmid) [Nostoc sp. C057]|uniref:hypothetical protein n=1 Tax=Nostoc sp. C057 TaxID=2576903 RepID=UPI0015C3D454|nr:hypothetical protein [Nostoc sp. C057]QLE53721.1 hypothetical protein FD724_38355 [Nostoc sp. C057]